MPRTQDGDIPFWCLELNQIYPVRFHPYKTGVGFGVSRRG
jgi:hypothetical protein